MRRAWLAMLAAGTLFQRNIFRPILEPSGIGVAEWRTRLVATLPKNLRDALPSVKEIERELRE